MFSRHILEPMVAQMGRALECLRVALKAEEADECGDGAMRWIGGWLFQKDVFIFIYGSIKAAAEIKMAVGVGSDKLGVLQCLAAMVSDFIKDSRLGRTADNENERRRAALHPWLRDCLDLNWSAV